MSRTVVINNKFIPSDFLPIGFLGYIPYADIPAGWLVRDGTVYNIADYPELAAKLGNTYGGDGVTTFAVPDDRGLFERGLDLGKGVDAGRTLGSEQGDDFKSHTHLSGLLASGQPGSEASLLVDYPGGSGNKVSSSTGGAETRPKNRAYVPIIKAKNIYYDMTIQGGNAASLGGNPASYYAAASLCAKYTDFVQSHAVSGYQKLPSGLIIQWGYAATSPVTFPVAFTVACYSVVLTRYYSSSDYASVSSVSATGFTYSTASSPDYWMAIGK